MHVVVIAKHTPDTAAAVSLDGSGQVNWGSTMVVNPWDEYAVTEAILIKDAHKASVTVLATGDEKQQEVLKHALAVSDVDLVDIKRVPDWRNRESLLAAEADQFPPQHPLGADDADRVIGGHTAARNT